MRTASRTRSLAPSHKPVMSLTPDGKWLIERDDSRFWSVWPATGADSLSSPLFQAPSRKACEEFAESGGAAAMLALLECTHPEDYREWHFGTGTSQQFTEACARCKASRVWHVDMNCWSCDTVRGHDWFPQEV
jgi:hypothetical protein